MKLFELLPYSHKCMLMHFVGSYLLQTTCLTESYPNMGYLWVNKGSRVFLNLRNV